MSFGKESWIIRVCSEMFSILRYLSVFQIKILILGVSFLVVLSFGKNNTLSPKNSSASVLGAVL